MSVAFRRESDDEHKEPVFELPLPPGPNLVTARGKALIDAQVAALNDRIAAADEAAAVRLQRDRRYWTTRQVTAVVAPDPPAGEVAFGSRVTYRLDGVNRTVQLVGSDEADPATGLIPFTAPLARALIGAEAGETVDFGGRADAIAVVSIG